MGAVLALLLALNAFLVYRYWKNQQTQPPVETNTNFTNQRYEYEPGQNLFYAQSALSGLINCDTSERQGVGTSVPEVGVIQVVLQNREEKVIRCY